MPFDEGKGKKDVDISLKLSIVKPFHAKWLVEMYNLMTSSEGRDVCLKGWKMETFLMCSMNKLMMNKFKL